MLLSEILDKIEFEKVENFIERDVSSVFEHSKHLEKESVFICLGGQRTHGKEFLPDARERGCKIFVCEEKIMMFGDETLILVKNARKSSAEISKILYLESVSKLKIIGVTGTKGKTTTSKLIFECAKVAFEKAVLIGTLGIESNVGIVSYYSVENTTPCAPLIYKTLYDAKKLGAECAVIEVSSQALADERVLGIPFDACVFTNFSPDHIGISEHKNTDEYFEAKRKLFFENPYAVTVVNSDDSKANEITEHSKMIIRVGRKSSCDFVLEKVVSTYGSTDFEINGYPFKLAFGGEYNAINATLALAAVSSLSNAHITHFYDAIKNVRVSGRYEVYKLGDISIIIDFAHNEASFRSVYNSVKSFCRGRIISVFGSVGERSKSRRRALAEVSELYADISVITADNPNFESSEAICEDIFRNFHRRERAIIIPDRKEAIEYSLKIAEPGDCVLLLGKGHEEYQLICGKKIQFSERDIITKLGAEELFLKNPL